MVISLNGTWCERQKLSALRPSTVFGPVQPLGLRSTVKVHIDEVEAGRRAPMAKQARLDVFGLERLSQQRVVEKINLPDREVVSGPPPGVHQLKLIP